MSWIFDFDDDDFAFPLSDGMAMDSDGDLLMKMGDNLAIDLKSGDLHFVSGWSDDSDHNDIFSTSLDDDDDGDF